MAYRPGTTLVRIQSTAGPVRRRPEAGPRHIQALGALILIGGLGAYYVLVTLVAPISARVYYDPALQYMLTSLEPFVGSAYHYTDHPGTPLEVIGTAILALTYPLASSAMNGAVDGFVSYHLGHPEVFMGLAQTLLTIVSMGTCLLLVHRSVPVMHRTHALASVGLAGAFFGLHSEALTTLAIWSHTSFCFIGGTLLSLLVVLTVRRPRPPSWRSVLGLGIACGVLTSVQLYFAAWVVGAALALAAASRLHGSRMTLAVRRAEVTVGAAILGFILATLPIHDRYIELIAWIVRLTTHQGIYGEGPDGFSTPDRLASNLLELTLHQPLLSVATIIGVVLAAWRVPRLPRERIGYRAAAIGLVAQIVVLLVLVAKHPGDRYLLPVAASLPVLWAVVVASFDPTSLASRRLSTGVGLAGLCLFFGGLVSATSAHLALAESVHRDDVGIAAWLGDRASERGLQADALHVFWTYGTASQCQALWFAEYSANNVFANQLGPVCPHDGSIDVWKEVAWSASGHTPVANLTDWDVEVIPAAFVRTYPKAVMPGVRYETSFSSISPSYGSLVFIFRR